MSTLPMLLRRIAILGCALSVLSAKAAIEYLPSGEVLDTNTNLIWLKPSATANLALDNVYTRNGWALSRVDYGPPPLNYGPLSLESVFTGNFPIEVQGGAPYNPAITQLLLFLGGYQAPNSLYTEIGGLQRNSFGSVFETGIGYDGYFSFEGSESIPPEEFVPSSFSRLWLYRSPRTGPMLWTIERRRTGGPDVFGSFVYNQSTRTISDVRIKTAPSPYPAQADDYGVLHDNGALYTRVIHADISPDGALSSVLLQGAPIGAPDLKAYYYLGYFDGGLRSECDPEACRSEIPGQIISWIDLTDAGEIVCGEGVEIGVTCFGWEGPPTTVSYRRRVGSGSHQVVFPSLAEPKDYDADGVVDLVDNCRTVANPGQCDSDGDGYGNRCDGDLNNGGFTNAQDTTLFRGQLGQPSLSPGFNKADLNCNGAVNAQDTALYRQLLGSPPGPSGLHP